MPHDDSPLMPAPFGCGLHSLLMLVALQSDIESVVDVSSLLAAKIAKAASFYLTFHSIYYRSD